MNAILTVNCGVVTKIPLNWARRLLRAIDKAFPQTSAKCLPIHTYLHRELSHIWVCLILKMMSIGKSLSLDVGDAAFIDFL